ncbi:MAG: hypothetical protein ACRDF0_10915 [Candidatus Limnocylindria bacterium]
MHRDQLGVRVVDQARDAMLVLRLREVHVRGGEREDLDVDADAVHAPASLDVRRAGVTYGACVSRLSEGRA